MFWTILLVYLLASAVTFIMYAVDKERARGSEFRIKEVHLHACELLGGWPGAFVAQRMFRHKWRKTEYMVVFWIIVLVHILLWGWYFKAHV